MKLSEIAVKYSFLGHLLSVMLICAGVVALFRSNRDAFPNFSFDIVIIRTELPGASPEETEKLVTLPLEEEIDAVDGLDKYESVSTEGLSIIIITIDPDEENKDRVIQEIQRAVDRTEDLPADIEDKPLVKEIRTKDTPIIEVSLNSDLPYADLRRYAKTLGDRLKDLDEVSTVIKLGYRDREMSVEVNPQLLGRHHIALNEVMQALAKQNRNIPGGKVTRGSEEFILRTIGEFSTPEEIGATIIRANDDGEVIRIRDIAKVEDTYDEDQVLYRTNGKPAINLVVLKREQADAIRLVEDVKKTVDAFRKETPDTVKFQMVNDLSYYIKRRLGILVNNGLGGFILVVASLMLFLSPGIALMTALDFPIVVCVTFAVMKLLGISINLISMFGLIIVLGMLVDDSIVIAENIDHHLKQGEDPEHAAIAATREVAIPILATVTTTIAAFIPLALMSGIMGKFVRSIPIVVTIALCASLFEAIFMLPGHVADFAKWRAKRAHKAKKHRDLLEGMSKKYEVVLAPMLRFRYIFALLLTGLFLFSAWFALNKLDFKLFSDQDIEIFFVRGETPVGTSLEETQKRFVPLEQEVAKLPPEVLDAYAAQIGLVQNDPNDPFTKRGSNVGQVVVFLTPAQGRKITANQIITEFRKKLQAGLGQGDFERIWIDRVNPGPPIGKPIAIRSTGESFVVLEEMGEMIKKELQTVTGVVEVQDDYEFGKRELVFQVKPDVAAWAGLTVEDVAQTVQVAFDGGIATVIKTPEEDIDVVVRFPREYRGDPSSLKKVFVRNAVNNLIPLSAVTENRIDQGVSAIKHLNGKRVLTVTADVTEGVTTSAKVNQIMRNRLEEFKKKFMTYGLLFSGEQEDTDKSLNDLKVAFALALVLNFLILCGTFRNVVQPFMVMTSIPLSLIGVVFAFYFHGLPLGFMALMGIVGLSGVVVDNAIVLVDGVNKNREQGMSLREAVIKGSSRRLRPVLSTSLTTVVGLGPVSYGLGGSDPFVTPMALAMSWGLGFCTLVTLFAIPCFYLITEDGLILFRKAFRRISGSPDTEELI